MNNGKMIKKHFDFLCDYGFKRKHFSNGTDYEIIYEMSNAKIGVSYAASIPNELGESLLKDSTSSKTFDKEKYIKSIMEAPLIYAIDVIIAKNNEGKNLLKCSLFVPQQLETLAKEIANCDKDCEKQLKLYSNFIQNNIGKII